MLIADRTLDPQSENEILKLRDQASSGQKDLTVPESYLLDYPLDLFGRELVE